MSTYPRETDEYVRIGDVTIDGAPAVPDGVAIVELHERPVVFSTPVDLGGAEYGARIVGLPRGEYVVFVKVGTVVVEAGGFEIT